MLRAPGLRISLTACLVVLCLTLVWSGPSPAQTLKASKVTCATGVPVFNCNADRASTTHRANLPTPARQTRLTPRTSLGVVRLVSGFGLAAKAPSIVRVGEFKLPGVPRGATGTPVQTGKGLEYEIPRGTPELDPRVTHVRVMDPVTSGKYQYPDGYAVYMNKAGQTVDPLTGQTIGPKNPLAHIPLK